MCDSARRRCLLGKLKCMVDCMPDNCCMPQATPAMCPLKAPVIEIYDPSPKPAIPLGGPAPVTPLDPTVPVPHVASPTNPCGGCCIPIISPQPVPCIPLAQPCPVAEQPCVPCNPPQMMVAYRRGGCAASRGMGGGGGGGGRSLGRCKSRELRCSQLMRGCICSKRNGLQDDCERYDCLTNPCLYGPKCCYSGNSAGGGGGGGCCGDFLAEYQCFPAYFRLPPGAPTPCSPRGCCPVPTCPAVGCSPMGDCGPTSPLPPFIPMAGQMDMGTTPPICPDCPGPCMPQCCPPVPTIALPPCPPITVPAPPPVIPTPVPIPVATPVYPTCPPPMPPVMPPCSMPCCPPCMPC